jgi:hypothetical protein
MGAPEDRRDAGGRSPVGPSDGAAGRGGVAYHRFAVRSPAARYAPRLARDGAAVAIGAPAGSARRDSGVLAAYLTWQLRAALAPLTYTDERPPARDSPARRSARAGTKAATHTSPDGQQLGCPAHLATLTRTTTQLGDDTFEKNSDPTSAQRRAFDLIGVPTSR